MPAAEARTALGAVRATTLLNVGEENLVEADRCPLAALRVCSLPVTVAGLQFSCPSHHITCSQAVPWVFVRLDRQGARYGGRGTSR